LKERPHLIVPRAKQNTRRRRTARCSKAPRSRAVWGGHWREL